MQKREKNAKKNQVWRSSSDLGLSDSRADGAMRLITYRISTGEESVYLEVEFEIEI